jgi:hypothetical protein
MSQRESKLSRDIMKQLRFMGVFCFKVHGGPTMMAGLPDIIACVDGLFVGIETKHPETRADLSPRQDYVHTMIRVAHGRVFIVSSVDEATRIVKQIRAAENWGQLGPDDQNAPNSEKSPGSP